MDALTARARAAKRTGARNSLYLQLEETVARDALMLSQINSIRARWPGERVNLASRVSRGARSASASAT